MRSLAGSSPLPTKRIVTTIRILTAATSVLNLYHNRRAAGAVVDSKVGLCQDVPQHAELLQQNSQRR